MFVNINFQDSKMRMKQSITSTASGSRRRSLYDQFYHNKDNFIRLDLCVQSKRILQRPKPNISSNAYQHRQETVKGNSFYKQNLHLTNASKCSLNSINFDIQNGWKQNGTVLSPRNRLQVDQESNQMCQFTFNKSFREQDEYLLQKSLNQQCNESIQLSKTIIADSFSGSFKAAFGFYVELFFQKMTVCLQLKSESHKVFKHLANLTEFPSQNLPQTVQIDTLSLNVYRLIKNKNSSYKISDVERAFTRIFLKKRYIQMKYFARIFQTNQYQASMANPSKYLMGKTLEQNMKSFFEVLVQFYDTQAKLRKICKANEHKLIKMLVQLSLGQDLSLKLMAQFLYSDVKKSKSWLILRFQSFFTELFGDSDLSLSFLKWVKQIN